MLFEVISAFATVGLSTGITPDLPPPAQVVVIVLMFVGRVGTHHRRDRARTSQQRTGCTASLRSDRSLAKNSTSRDSVVVIGLGRFGGAGRLLAGPSGARGARHRRERRPGAALVGQAHPRRAGRRDRQPRRCASSASTIFGRAVVGIGTDIEASVLTVLALHELGVDEIWAKAITAKHGQILERTARIMSSTRRPRWANASPTWSPGE